MRLIQFDSSSVPNGRLAVFARLFAAACVLSMPLLAFSDPGPGGPDRSVPPGSGSSGGSVAGDETIGTLPSQGPDVPFELVRFVMDHQANVFLQGNRWDVLSAIVGVRGSTVATVQVIDAANDVLRFTFHGTPQLLLDRAALESGALVVGVRVPRGYGDAVAATTLAGRTVSISTPTAGAQTLPVGAFLTAGLLDSRTLSTEVQNGTGAFSRITVRSTRGVVVVQQSH